MTELSQRQKMPRCQTCGHPVQGHPAECYSISRSAFDLSHSHLVDVDQAAGDLLAAIVKLRTVETVQGSHYASEFFTLLDLRRKS